MIKASEYCAKIFDGTHDTPKPTQSGEYLVTSKCLLDGKIDFSSAYKISKEDYNEVNRRSQVSQYDILFSMIGTIGNTYLEESSDINYAIKNIGVFSCRNREKAIFLYYYLQSPYAKKYIERSLDGAVQKFLSLEKMRNFPVPEFSESTYKAVSELRRIDDKISTNNKIIETSEKLMHEIYDYWFVQFDFPSEEGRPYKSSGGKMIHDDILNREIPDDWKITTIKDVISHINTGLNPRQNFVLNNGDIKYITVKNLTTKGAIDFTTCDTIDEEALKKVHKRSDISKGDILFASIAPLGRCVIIREDPNGWDINESVFSIRPKSKNLSEYLYMFFMNEAFIKKAEQSSTGSVFSGIRISVLEDMKIVVPPEDILDKFNQIVSPIFDLKYRNELENQKLKELRDFLLPLLLNNQITIANES